MTNYFLANSFLGWKEFGFIGDVCGVEKVFLCYDCCTATVFHGKGTLVGVRVKMGMGVVYARVCLLAVLMRLFSGNCFMLLIIAGMCM